jgi:ABC-type dipeptide/oligopeptide/nickel transport system permease component
MKLTKAEEYTLKFLSPLRIMSSMVLLIGFLGAFLGLYAAFFRRMSLDARPLNFSLIAYSIGVFVLGILLRQAYNIIDKLKEQK